MLHDGFSLFIESSEQDTEANGAFALKLGPMS